MLHIFAARPRLLFTLLLMLAIGAAHAETNRWDADIAAFEAKDRTNPPPRDAIVFIGSSSIRLWKTLEQDFPEHKVINRGFGGSETGDSVHFADRVVLPYRPKLVVMYAGGNDINSGKTPERVAANFKAFVEKVQAKLPHTRIAYISIAPNPARWAQVDRVKRANDLIREFTKASPDLTFIDVFPHMLGEDGQPRPEIFGEDRLHMNERGYALWTKLVRPALSP
jgi:lysophospholipase L1-like esterase